MTQIIGHNQFKMNYQQITQVGVKYIVQGTNVHIQS
jgi:hypothetical protein